MLIVQTTMTEKRLNYVIDCWHFLMTKSTETACNSKVTIRELPSGSYHQGVTIRDLPSGRSA